MVRYQCKGALQNHGAPRCIDFGGLQVDKKISALLLEAISPLGVEAALKAIKTLEEEQDESRNHHALALKQARYDAERIERQLCDRRHDLACDEFSRRDTSPRGPVF